VAEGVVASLLEDQDKPLRHAEAALFLTATARETISPLHRLEKSLHPWVAFGIMPLFALANAGVKIEPSAVADPISTAVAAALLLGKPLGIVLLSWIAVRIGLARLPSGVNWPIMLGAGLLAGIGFTMSLFIAGLALSDELLAAGKIGTLIGSALSAVLGLGLLKYCLTNERYRPHDTV